MPELPEVQTVVDTLAPFMCGKRITYVELSRTDVVTPAGFPLTTSLQGRRIRSVERRAKRIVVTLDDQNRFYIHLGMSGRLVLGHRQDVMKRHTHLRIGLDRSDGQEIRFVDPRRFGGVWWLGQEADSDDLGPEPLTLGQAELRKRLASTSRAVKTALLDQRLIAGLGNIYVDESLHEARIHPQTPSSNLTRPEVARLNKAIKTTLKRALRHRGSTLRDYRDAAGDPGYFQNLHRVYDREGEACKRCGTEIVRIVIGGRSTHYCPKCQDAHPPSARKKAERDER